MASKVQFKEGKAGSGTSVATAASTFTAGNAFLAFVGHTASDTNPVLTDTTHSVAFTRALLVNGLGGSNAALSLFWLTNITGGSTVVTLTGIGGGGTIMLQEWTGIQTATPVDVSTSNINSGVASSAQSTGTTGATANAVELAYAGASNDQPNNAAPSAVSGGWTLSDVEPDGTAFWPVATAFKETSSTGTQTNTFTWTGTLFAAGIAVFFEAAAGGPTILLLNQMPNTLIRM